MKCSIDGCERDSYHYRTMCNPHYMRLHRYGDPHWCQSPRYRDLRGQRFGTLVVRERVGNRWLCDCDCGNTRLAAAGGLNRNGDRSVCGDKQAHYRKEIPNYSDVHNRLAYLRGPARDHRCVECGGQAAHWSYDHGDPDELLDLSDRGSLPYSPKPEHYQARCAACHKTFDLERIHAKAEASR